jgi:hypothetical protein
MDLFWGVHLGACRFFDVYFLIEISDVRLRFCKEAWGKKVAQRAEFS